MSSIFKGRTYCAEDGDVFVNPSEVRNDDRTKTISMGFKLLTVSDHVDGRYKVAEAIADLLTKAVQEP
jgi:hypothetical protein